MLPPVHKTKKFVNWKDLLLTGKFCEKYFEVNGVQLIETLQGESELKTKES